MNILCKKNCRLKDAKGENMEHIYFSIEKNKNRKMNLFISSSGKCFNGHEISPSNRFIGWTAGCSMRKPFFYFRYTGGHPSLILKVGKIIITTVYFSVGKYYVEWYKKKFEQKIYE